MFTYQFLWKISGGDYSVITVCERKIQRKFAGVGLIVVCIALLCFVASYYSLSVLFENYILSLPIALFFSWMITNIYIVLLTTLQKNLLPHFKSGGSVIFSLLIRIMFLIYFAVLTSKPIEVLLFRNNITQEINIYKEKIVKEFIEKTKSYYRSEELAIKKVIRDHEEMRKLNINLSSDINALQNKLIEVSNKKMQTITVMEVVCKNSQFYIEEIKILSTNSKHFYSWFITLIIIFIFLLPAILKYYISETSSYYARKAKIEKDIIENHYMESKKIFTELLFQQTGKNIYLEEKFKDAPFNTIPIGEKRLFEKEEDFISLIYGA